MTDERDDLDETDDLDDVCDAERAEADALARRLDGSHDAEGPEDALGAAALLRGVAGAASLEGRLGEVEKTVLGSPDARVTNLRSRRPRASRGRLVVAVASTLSLAAALTLYVTSGVPLGAPQSTESAASTAAAPAPPQATPTTTTSGAVQAFAADAELVTAERGVLTASGDARAQALMALRLAMEHARDVRFSAILERQVGSP